MDKENKTDDVVITVFQKIDVVTEVPFSVPRSVLKQGVNAVIDYVHKNFEDVPYGQICAENIHKRECDDVRTSETKELMKCYLEHGL